MDPPVKGPPTPAAAAAARGPWRVLAYALALALPVAMLGLRLAVSDAVGPRPMALLFVLPVIAAALLGGLGPGLLSTAMTAALVAVGLLAPTGSLVVDATPDRVVLAVLVFEGLAVSLMAEALHRALAARTAEAGRSAVAEAARRASEAQLRLLLDHTPAALALFDREMRYIAVNRRWLESHDLWGQAVVGQSHYALFPDMPNHWRDAHRRALAGEVVTGTAEPLQRRDGSTLWGRWEVHPWRAADGSIGGVVIFAENVTARVVAEQALRDSQQRLAEAQRVAAIGSWQIDLPSQRLWWSDECFRLFERNPALGGLTYEEFLGYVHPDDRQRVDTAYKASLETRQPYDVVHRMLLSSGTLRQVRERGETQYGADGQPVRTLGTVQDVTELLQIRERLDQLAQVVQQSPAAVLMTDLDQRIVYVNEAFERQIGYSRDEALGRDPRMMRSDRTPPAVLRLMKEALVAGQAFAGDIVNRRKDGSTYPAHVTITPLKAADGRRTHLVGVIQDISERVRLTEELDRHRHHLEELVQQRTAELEQARVAAEAANRAKSEFLANMSHEIRTPLNAILGLTHLLQREVPTQRQAERLHKVADAGRHLLSVINDVLDLSKIESGQLTLHEQVFSPQDLLGSVEALVADSAAAKGLALRVEAHDLPARLRGDSTRLRQALLNLAGNAVKFTEQGQVVLTIDVSHHDAEGAVLRFEVLDSGVGIEADALRRLFQPFVQVDASSTRRHGGTGLGLAITRRLAQAMGGEAGASSQPGVGSRFWFTARLAWPPGVTAEPPPASEGAEPRFTGEAAQPRLARAAANPQVRGTS